MQIPFCNYVTGYSAFTHKAGIHAKAILNNPETYEILNPNDFGMCVRLHQCASVCVCVCVFVRLLYYKAVSMRLCLCLCASSIHTVFFSPLARTAGMTRYVHVAHRLTGWNAIKNRAMQLSLPLSDDQIKEATGQIKACDLACASVITYACN